MRIRGSDVITVDELEECLRSGMKLGLAAVDAPPFCGNLERAFVRGTDEKILSDFLLGTLLFDSNVVSPVWVQCDRVITRRDGMSTRGVVDGGFLSGCVTRNCFFVSHIRQFFLGRMSCLDHEPFADWIADRGIARSTFGEFDPNIHRGDWYKGQLKNGLSLPKRAQRGAGPSLRNFL